MRTFEGAAKGDRVVLAQAAAPVTPLDQALGLGMGWAARSRTPVALLALHLSQLHEPGPRPHHRRIAASLLDSAVQAHGGQVFACPNGDLAIVTEPSAAARLVVTLSALFRVESPGADRLLALWSLPTDEASARASLTLLAAPTTLAPEDHPVPLGAIAAAEAVLASTPFEQLMRRQTAILLSRSGIVPLYQEISISLAALEARMGVPTPFAADPFLFRHLAARLDTRVLELAVGGRPATGLPLHLNLTLPGLSSPAFARLAGTLPPHADLGVEIEFMEAVADPPRMAEAASILGQAGCSLVLDGVDHSILSLARPGTLHPALLKLDWSPRMAALPGRERRLLEAAMDALGPERIVLHRAETEAALAWGREYGIRRFQGRHVDAILAASRIGACHHAAGCTLRQCIDRANATGHADRAGCRDLALLDAAVPPIAHADA